jgi:sugar O-acyltransferase (sialic acid O-acetyltransferase NeuD family)
MSGLVIIGAGGHGREVHDVVLALDLEFIGFAADEPVDHELIAPRGPHLGGIADALKRHGGASYVVAVGDGKARKRLSGLADAAGLRAATLIHPEAIVGSINVVIGSGSVICAGAQVTTDVEIGVHTHLNRGAQVGHDARIGDFVTLHPGAVLSGGVRLGEGVTIGTNATVIPQMTIGAWTMIGAGATVVTDLPAGLTAVGSPARSTSTPRRRSPADD